jgi:hypothetical protein
MKYHDARPASKFTFLKRLSRSFRRDSMLSSGGYYNYPLLIIGSEVSITIYDVLMAFAVA